MTPVNVKENKQILARNITRFMERKGVSRQQLCSTLDIKYTTFRDWIKGITYPRIDKLELLASYFGCEKADLVEDKSDESEPILFHKLSPVKQTIMKFVAEMSEDEAANFLQAYLLLQNKRLL